MIKIENVDIHGWEAAIRGARNAMNSWDKIDSVIIPKRDGSQAIHLGDNDYKLLSKLANAGPDHGKFLRMVMVWCDITAPFYLYKELDTYRVGVEKNSCSTMHKIHAKEFTLDDFSLEHLKDITEITRDSPLGMLAAVISELNYCRKRYLETKDKQWWWQLIQLLPSSYNQRRTYMFSYQALRSIYHARKNHKLDEWHDFCAWIETLPYSELITGGDNPCTT